MSLGLMPSLNMASINDGYLRAGDIGDPSIPNSSEVQYQPNLHAGILFESKRNFFLSASIENLLEPNFSFGAPAQNTIERNYHFFGGTERVISRDLTLRPFLLIRSDLNSYSLEISSILEYRGKTWGGISYRSAESMTLLIGQSFLKDNQLKAGYSFDYIVSNRTAKQNTSHEIYLRYNLPNLVFAGRKAIKTPRFSF